MKKTITFIGNGNMATSMAKTLKNSYLIEVVGRNLENLDTFEAAVGTDVTKHLLNDFDITGKTLLLCVKPANIAEVGTKLHGKAEALYSVLAGTKVETLKNHIAAAGTVRAMPNLAATVGRSMTTLTGDRHLEAEA
ncbi:MAG: NAD(P)-binding domain-containing protein, partial [Campylobacterales bacterium]|nr:NAD(P)-binding domain-containing protein [Campylobacterales bacterium]